MFFFPYFYSISFFFFFFFFFFFNDTATTEIYTLSLHDALPLSLVMLIMLRHAALLAPTRVAISGGLARSEEHTSELQSRSDLVCRLLLEKKKKNQKKLLSLSKKKKAHKTKI